MFMPAECLVDDEFDEDGFVQNEDLILQSPSRAVFQQDHQEEEKVQLSTPRKTFGSHSYQRMPEMNFSQRGYTQSQTQFPPQRKENESRFGNRPSSWTGSSPLASQYVISSPNNVLTEDDLKIAAVKGNVTVVQQCLQQGIPVNQVLQSGWTPLMFACSHGHSHVVEAMLKAGADPSFHVDLYTPLMCACSTHAKGTRRLDCVKMILEAGADVNARDRHHTTGLMLSAGLGHLDIVCYLIEQGANVNEQDARGWTALTWAVQRGHKDAVLTLLQSGADCNIQHSDRLTVKDMAAHLPTDEMLALLEHRPPRMADSGDLVSAGIMGQRESPYSLLGEGDDSARSTDLRYGELEIFLLSLNLPHLVPIFHKHLIDLHLLLDLTEQDLMNAGIDQVGARKKILDASQAVHKKNWETSSLVSVHFNKQIGCADALAMVTNACKHIRYINSTVVYIKEQLKHHPQSLIHATDRASPTQLARHVTDTIQYVDLLHTELATLQNNLSKEMKNFNVYPPDLIPPPVKLGKTSFLSLRRCICLSGVIGICAGILFLSRNHISVSR